MPATVIYGQDSNTIALQWPWRLVPAAIIR